MYAEEKIRRKPDPICRGVIDVEVKTYHGMKSRVCCQQCKVALCIDCFRPYHLQIFTGMF